MSPGRRTWQRKQRDGGTITIPLALLFPVVLAMVLLVVQAGLWWYARQVALTAAREGSEAARAYGAGPAQGVARARSVLDRVGTGLSQPRVTSAGSSSQQVRISVTVHASSLLPGLDGKRVTQRVTAPVERWTRPGEAAGPARTEAGRIDPVSIDSVSTDPAGWTAGRAADPASANSPTAGGTRTVRP